MSGTIQVSTPAGFLNLEVTAADTVLDLREFILEYPEVCHLTCFHLFFQGRRLTIFSELSHYPGLFQSSAQVTLRPGRYDEGEVRLHLEKFRQIHREPPSKLCAMGMFETRRRQRSSFPVPTRTLNDFKPPSLDDTPTRTDSEFSYEYKSTDFRLPFLSETLSSPTVAYPRCLKRIRPSDFNPPPGNRKLRGDILFIEVETLEGEVLILTAAADGFFINNSSLDNFDPEPRKRPKIVKDTTLVGLLLQASALFRENYRRLLWLASESHPLSNLSLPFPITEWCAKPKLHVSDCSRAEEFLVDNFGAELRAPQRDWNEEYQSLVSINQSTVEDRIIRDRSVFRFYVDFVHAAHRGAKAIIEGAIPPLNPMDPQRSFVYVFNCIFFSLAVDARSQYADADGDMTAYKMASHDVKGLLSVQSVDNIGIHLLATCLIDYCGQRVVAQALIPGILHGEQSESLVYGSIDVGQEFCFHEEFHEKLVQLGKQVGWKQHTAFDQTDKKINLVAAAESKGIIGSDKRLYLLDLIRCFPRDPNFPDPVKGVDKLLRPEIIRSYEEHSLRIKQVEHQRLSSGVNPSPEDDVEKLVLNVNCLSRVKLENEKEDLNTLKSIAHHLEDAIERLAKQLVSTSIYVVDNEHLSELLHSRGINMRYLGRLCGYTKGCKHVTRMIEREMVIRAAKEVFCKVMMRLSEGGRQAYYESLHHDSCSNISTIATIVRMFLNSVCGKHCWMKGLNSKILRKARKINTALLRQHDHFLENCSSLLTEDPFHSIRSEQRSSDVFDGSDHVFHPSNVWQAIQDTIRKKFDYNLVGLVGKKKALPTDEKYCLLRGLCKKIGVQVLCRDYDWSLNEPISDKDIEDVFHIIKAAVPECFHATQMAEQAKVLLAQHEVESAYETLQNVMSLAQAVYGPVHSKTVEIHSLLGIAAYRLDHYAEAVDNQTRATMLSEKVHGIDHFRTARHFSLLALFCHTAGLYQQSFCYQNRSIYLHTLTGGRKTIGTILEIINLGTLHLDHSNGSKALDLFTKVRDELVQLVGEKHFRVAQCEHLIALCYGVDGSLDLAYKHECRANNILKENRLNPSKFWRRNFKPAHMADVSSSESEGRMPLTTSDSPLVWNSHHNVEFKGKLGTLSLVNRLTELRHQGRQPHEPILRCSPDYKPRRTPPGERNKTPPVLNLPKNMQSKKKKTKPLKKNSMQNKENIEALRRKVVGHEARLRKLFALQRRDPGAVEKEEIRQKVMTLKKLKGEILVEEGLRAT